jgi:hypothetical protein
MNSSDLITWPPQSEEQFPVPVLAEPKITSSGEAQESNPTSPAQKGAGVLRRENPFFKTQEFKADDVVMHPVGHLDLLGRSTPRYSFTQGMGRRKFVRVESRDITGKTIWNIIELK